MLASGGDDGALSIRDVCVGKADSALDASVYAGSAWDELEHIRQAIGFLVLSLHQLYRISTMYWDDKYGTQSVSADVRFFFPI
ncbi:hypothetical protein HanRHA438_Chr11g0501281 [Helianthus annuus]|uniref:Uncharacterized protein n=1 Tax=Helianthus annuus TaxID=4232 RepID=A0A9K3HP64_HELAN|nr:hypothetical protein HanXRQr2_Chr11g0488441 [Helianthus annuus]KAJ0501380.1 hypothetical protein HanHA300_Chr11g0400151 [Helianthus annuus]KAJ0509173.1 hypothetical protein HanIR_Chr11g0525811 [Helianthus annuus]KAJ0517286.1 hypothetical protein HanHA89_Chr11g0423651 [Helianthus annuus]KAJ0685298.1 hypothetical protein HanLR1_Chr11g0401111 [Helianthus annuus]